jgi:hypothetical protein
VTSAIRTTGSNAISAGLVTCTRVAEQHPDAGRSTRPGPHPDHAVLATARNEL